MKAFLFNYRCARCNTVTKAPGLPDMAYGQFIMFNDSGDAVYLDSFNDPIFDEFEELFTNLSIFYNEINESNATDIFQTIFTITCDPSIDGSRYSLTGLAPCKNCGSREMTSWGIITPSEFTDELASPTYEHWNALSKQEKVNKIKEAIENELT